MKSMAKISKSFYPFNKWGGEINQSFWQLERILDLPATALPYEAIWEIVFFPPLFLLF